MAAGQEGGWPPVFFSFLLTARRSQAMPPLRGWSGDRGSWIRGKSGLHEAMVPGNARPGQPEGKRHREQTAAPLFEAAARVKRWGKSPPRDGQPDRHGKPHQEQCRIGASRGLIGQPISPQGRLSPGARVGSLNPPVTAGSEEWSPKGGTPEQNPAYRPSARFACMRVHPTPYLRPKRR